MLSNITRLQNTPRNCSIALKQSEVPEAISNLHAFRASALSAYNDFLGYVIYSYGTQIARITNGIAYIVTKKYSVTTSRHQHIIQNTFNNMLQNNDIYDIIKVDTLEV